MSPLHDSRTGLFRLLPPARRLGVIDPEHESAASTALSPRAAGGYEPPGLVAYLADAHHGTNL